MWGLIIGVCVVVVAIGLRVEGKIDNGALTAFLIVALGSGMAIAYFGSTKKLKAGLEGFEFEAFQGEVNTIKQEALDKLKKEVDNQKRVIAKYAEETTKAIIMVAEEAAPPLLNLTAKEIKQIGEEYQVKLRFWPSKNVPLGWLVFTAEIIGDSQATITKLNPYDIQVYGSPGKVSDGGRKAVLGYVPIGPLDQTVMLRVSAPCDVRISCSHMREPLEFEIK